MTEPNTYRAYFTLVGDFDPDYISNRLDLTPTRSWRKGEINPKTELERKHSRWCLDSRLAQTESLESHVTDVIRQLQPSARKIAEIRQAVDGGMQLVAYFYTDYPGFSLDEGTLSDLAQLKLGIDCDFYYLYSDKREDSE